MKKILINITVFMVIVLLTSSIAYSQLVRQANYNFHTGSMEKMVYDRANKSWWYPTLSDMFQMTRAEQNNFINGKKYKLYGNTCDWSMADYNQVSDMKRSLASMGSSLIPWDFSHMMYPDPIFPDPTLDDRDVSSPFLAWYVYSEQFFTPCQNPGFKLMGRFPALSFNGRLKGYTWRRNHDMSITWSNGEADDHWMSLPWATAGELATMAFNFDTHYLADNAREHGFFFPNMGDLGQVGAWVISTKGPKYFGVKSEIVAYNKVAILGGSWFKVNQIDANSICIYGKNVDCTEINDTNNDGYNDLIIQVKESYLCYANITGKLKSSYGSIPLKGNAKPNYNFSKENAGVMETIVPEEYALIQNFPNPFNPETEIGFNLPEENFVILKIYNSLGQEIRTLLNENAAAGQHKVRWDGLDNLGNPLQSGIYFYRIQAGEFSQMKKMTLMR